MKRSSFMQFTIMVEFMERFGVLSKPVGGPHGRQYNIAAKLRNSMRGTGRGPALKICLTDLEQRIMDIIGKQAATGMQVPEIGFAQIQTIQQEPEDDNIIVLDEDWNMLGTSEVPIIISTQDLAPPMPSPPATTPEPNWTPPPPKKKTKTSTAANTFIQERIRQRDTVMQLQAQWLEICKEILKMIKEYLSKDSSA
ncbi:hypothetical protein ABMA28_010597 [Loxostege sticticalis]|uniref:Uncharacterized protein n=1 Tax=Loxostege sticticalis TaxID=481309 RepID=A0ABD0S9K0_LOXSC